MATIPWFKVDDKFHSHPKVMELTPSAVGLWALAGSWCADYLTDGSIRKGQIRRLGGSETEAQELVDADLWIPTDEGWQFRDWTEYQPTREAVEAEREAARERMRRAREHKGSSQDVRPNNNRSSRNPAPAPVTSKEVSAADTSRDDEAFNTWWATYPKKADKGQARKAFNTALKKTSLDELVNGAQRYANHVNAQGTERKFIKNPSTWLNAEAWENEDIAPAPQPAFPTVDNPGAFTNWSQDDYRPWHSRPHVVEAQERIDAARLRGEEPSDDDIATVAGPPGH